VEGTRGGLHSAVDIIKANKEEEPLVVLLGRGIAFIIFQALGSIN